MMPKRGQMTLWAFTLGFASLLAGTARAEDAPKFADYSGAAIYNGRNAAPVLATPDARRFRTRIREGAREKPNFDGHYVIVGWGCGTQCWNGAIIDVITGKVVLLPVVEAAMQQDAELIDYRLDSRLIVLNGIVDEKETLGSRYLEFDGGALKPVKTILRPEWDSAPPKSDKPR
jgi:hypothetical protein